MRAKLKITWKQIGSLFLAACMIITLLPLTAFAAADDEFTVDDLDYKVLTENEDEKTGTVVLIGGTPGGSLAIPATVTGSGISYTVTKIGREAFSCDDEITEVTIPDSVEIIGQEAFAQCSKLTKFTVDSGNEKFSAEDGVLYNKNKTILVQYPTGKDLTGFTFPSSVKTIGSYAFAYMHKEDEEGEPITESLVIGNRVEYIEDNAFNACEQLGEITIGSGVKEIGNDTFSQCNNLEEVSFISDSALETIGKEAFCDCIFTEFTIPDTVSSIGSGAFAYCNNLTSIFISKNIVSLGDLPFYVNEGLESINVDNNNQYYSSKSGVLYNKSGNTLLRYPASKFDEEFVIPRGVTTLGEGSFYANSNLKKLTIPSTVTKIEEAAFYWASAIKDIRFLGEIPPVIEIGSTFDKTDSLTDIYVPAGKVDAYKTALSSVLGDTDIIKEFAIPGAVKVRTPEDLIIALASTSPQAIWVVTDIDLGNTSQTIEAGADHRLIIDEGKTVSTGKAEITIPEDKNLTVDGTLILTEGSKLLVDGTVRGISGARLILEEGANLRGVDGIFEDRGYRLKDHLYITVKAEDEIPSAINLTGGEYIWNESESFFRKEGDINWGKGYGLVVAGTRVDENNADNIKGYMISGDGVISYDRVTKTLTLNDAEIAIDFNYNYKYGIYSSDDITIKLIGNSVIGYKDDIVDYIISYGIYAPGKDIIIAGDGNLNIYDGMMGILGRNITLNSTGNLTVKEYGGSRACCLKADGGTLTVNSGNINLTSTVSNGVYGDTIVINGGTITAQSETGRAFNKEAVFSSKYSYIIKEGKSPSDAVKTTKATFAKGYIKIEAIASEDSNGDKGGGGGGKNTATSSATDETVTVGIWVNPFTDVTEDSWYSEAVRYVYENNLMMGTGENTFNPNDMTTRGMIVTILHRLEGSPAAGANSFTDLEDKYYANAVAWASENNIASGYGNDKFGPEDSITREQLAAILMNYAKYKGYDITAKADLSRFEDSNDISSWARDALSWANAEGLIQGDNNNLMPAGNATRAQVAAILNRFAEKIMKQE